MIRGILELRSRSLNKEEQDVLNWLSSIDYSASQNRGKRTRKEETGGWFLESSDFKDWINSPGGLLWLNGVGALSMAIISKE